MLPHFTSVIADPTAFNVRHS